MLMTSVKRIRHSSTLLLFLLYAQFITTLLAMLTTRDVTGHDGDRRHATEQDGGVWSRRRSAPETAAVVVPETKNRKQEVKVVRYLKLLNRCSQRHLRLTSQRVDAKGAFDNIYSQLRIVSEDFGSQLRIQSAQTLNYLCFNKRGKLIVKHSGRDQGCVFREIYSVNHFTEFQSTENVTWFIGFRSSGQPLDGAQWTKRPPMARCRQFTKIRSPHLNLRPRDQTGTRYGPLRSHVIESGHIRSLVNTTEPEVRRQDHRYDAVESSTEVRRRQKSAEKSAARRRHLQTIET